MRSCTACATEQPDEARFCAECGTPLVAERRDPEMRKTVTTVFCDLAGSTRLGEANDPEFVRSVLVRYFSAMQAVLETHGGTVEKFIGDAVMAIFGVPVVREDDALRAVRAAAEMQSRMATLNDELEAESGLRLSCRIGVNTGDVVVGSGARGTVATGDAINVAARLEQAAGADEVLLGESTWQLVREAVEAVPVTPLDLKGKSEAVRAWRLQRVRSRIGRQQPIGSERNLVGRHRELRSLTDNLERCRTDDACRLVTVLGAAGLGKSRLASEFLAALSDDVCTLQGRCLSYGDGTGFWSLREMVRSDAGLTGDEAEADALARLGSLVKAHPEAARIVERLAPLAGLSGEMPSVDELHWAVRCWVEARAQQQPLVLVFDDVHWANASLLDIVEHLVTDVQNLPVLILCLARPEFLDDRADWSSETVNATTLQLSSLDQDESAALVVDVLGQRLEGTALDRIQEVTGGNPLFLEQMLAMMREDGALVEAADGWRAGRNLDELVVPPTIATLLAARLDRLAREERTALEAASVTGLVFYSGAVRELISGSSSTNEVLSALVSKELVRRANSDLIGEEAFRFLHVLVREAAYAGVSKVRRAQLHEGFARWLDKRRDSSSELDEFVAYHLERSVLLRQELRVGAELLAEPAMEAADRLSECAERIISASPRAAAALLERAAQLPVEPSYRLHLLLSQGEVLDRGGDPASAREPFQLLQAAARELRDARMELLAGLNLVGIIGDSVNEAYGEEEIAQEISHAQQSFDAFRRADDPLGVMSAARALTWLHTNNGRWGPLVDLTAASLPFAERLPLRYQASLLKNRLAALLWGPTPVSVALPEVEAIRERLGDRDRIAQVVGLLSHSIMLVYTDSPDEARTMQWEARRLAEHDRNPHLRMLVSELVAYAPALDEDEVIQMLDQGVQLFMDAGFSSYASTTVALLGEYRYRRGDLEEADRLAHLSRDCWQPGDVSGESDWSALMAKVEMHAGRLTVAQQLADQAVAAAERTDLVIVRRAAFESRSSVREVQGNIVGAYEDLSRAQGILEEKGDRPSARRLRAKVNALTARHPAS